MDEQKLQELYNAIVASKQAKLPDFNTFKQDMAVPEFRRSFYAGLQTINNSLPDFETFESDFGFAQPKPGAPTPFLANVAAAQAQPMSAAEMKRTTQQSRIQTPVIPQALPNVRNPYNPQLATASADAKIEAAAAQAQADEAAFQAGVRGQEEDLRRREAQLAAETATPEQRLAQSREMGSFGSLWAGLMRGGVDMVTNIYDALTTAIDDLPIVGSGISERERADIVRQKTLDKRELALEFKTNPIRMEDLESAGDVMDWLSGGLGQSLPSVAAYAAGPVAGSLINASAAYGDIYLNSVEQGAARESISVDEYVRQGKDSVVAPLVGAAASTALDQLGNLMMFRSLRQAIAREGFDAVKKGFAKRAVELGKAVASEGATEATQSAIEQGATALGSGGSLSEINPRQVLEEGVMGAALGGAFNVSGQATGAAIDALRNRQAAPQQDVTTNPPIQDATQTGQVPEGDQLQHQGAAPIQPTTAPEAGGSNSAQQGGQKQQAQVAAQQVTAPALAAAPAPTPEQQFQQVASMVKAKRPIAYFEWKAQEAADAYTTRTGEAVPAERVKAVAKAYFEGQGIGRTAVPSVEDMNIAKSIGRITSYAKSGNFTPEKMKQYIEMGQQSAKGKTPGEVLQSLTAYTPEQKARIEEQLQRPMDTWTIEDWARINDQTKLGTGTIVPVQDGPMTLTNPDGENRLDAEVVADLPLSSLQQATKLGLIDPTAAQAEFDRLMAMHPKNTAAPKAPTPPPTPPEPGPYPYPNIPMGEESEKRDKALKSIAGISTRAGSGQPLAVQYAEVKGSKPSSANFQKKLGSLDPIQRDEVVTDAVEKMLSKEYGMELKALKRVLSVNPDFTVSLLKPVNRISAREMEELAKNKKLQRKKDLTPDSREATILSLLSLGAMTVEDAKYELRNPQEIAKGLFSSPQPQHQGNTTARTFREAVANEAKQNTFQGFAQVKKFLMVVMKAARAAGVSPPYASTFNEKSPFFNTETNLVNYDNVADYIDYIENMIVDAEARAKMDAAEKARKKDYDAQITEINKLKNALKKAIRNKAAMRKDKSLARELMRVNPTKIRSLAEYKEALQDVLDTRRGVKGVRQLSNEDIEGLTVRFAQETKAVMEARQMDKAAFLRQRDIDRKLYTEQTAPSVQAYYDALNVDLDDKTQTLSKGGQKKGAKTAVRFIRESSAQELQSALKSVAGPLTKEEGKALKALRALDPTKLTDGELARFIQVAQNIEANDDFTGAGQFIYIANTEQQASRFQRDFTAEDAKYVNTPLFTNKKGKVTDWFADFTSGTTMIKGITIAARKSGTLYKYFKSGINRGYNKARQETSTYVQRINDKINAGSLSKLDQDVVALTLLTMQRVAGTDVQQEFEASKKELLQSLETESKEAPKSIAKTHAKQKLDAYQQLIEGATTPQELYDKLTPAQKALAEEWFGITGNFREQLFEMMRVYQGSTPVDYDYYFPRRTVTRESAQEVYETKLLDENGAVVPMRMDGISTREPGVIQKRAGRIDTEKRYLITDFAVLTKRAVEESMFYIHAQHEAAITAKVLSDPRIKERIGEQNAKNLITQISMQYRNERYGSVGDKALADVLMGFSQFTNRLVSAKLQSLSQLFKQTLPAFIAIGGRALVSPNSRVGLQAMLEGAREITRTQNLWTREGRMEGKLIRKAQELGLNIGQRAAQARDILDPRLLSDYGSGYKKGALSTLSKWDDVISKVSDDNMHKLVVAPDTIVSAMSWTVGFANGLARQGYFEGDNADVDFTLEMFYSPEKYGISQEMYDLAIADAEIELDTIMGPSISSDRAQLFNPTSLTGAVQKKIFLPLKSFSYAYAREKVRIISDLVVSARTGDGAGFASSLRNLGSLLLVDFVFGLIAKGWADGMSELTKTMMTMMFWDGADDEAQKELKKKLDELKAKHRGERIWDYMTEVAIVSAFDQMAGAVPIGIDKPIRDYGRELATGERVAAPTGPRQILSSLGAYGMGFESAYAAGEDFWTALQNPKSAAILGGSGVVNLAVGLGLMPIPGAADIGNISRKVGKLEARRLEEGGGSAPIYTEQLMREEIKKIRELWLEDVGVKEVEQEVAMTPEKQATGRRSPYFMDAEDYKAVRRSKIFEAEIEKRPESFYRKILGTTLYDRYRKAKDAKAKGAVIANYAFDLDSAEEYHQLERNVRNAGIMQSKDIMQGYLEQKAVRIRENNGVDKIANFRNELMTNPDLNLK